MSAPSLASSVGTPDDIRAFIAGGQRLAVFDTAGGGLVEGRLRRDVAEGLGKPRGQRTLPCSWFYDAEGSRLYERITELEEYYPTRTEARILRRIAPELRLLLGPAAGTLVELGSAYFKSQQDAGHIAKDVDVEVVMPLVQGMLVYNFSNRPGLERSFKKTFADPAHAARFRREMIRAAELLLGLPGGGKALAARAKKPARKKR